MRQFRHSAMRLFCIAIALACAVTFNITLLGDRLEQLFNAQAKEVIAADIVLQSTSKLTPLQEEIIEKTPLQRAEVITFQTMASTQQDQFLLSSVKAVTESYPLLGKLQVADQPYADSYTTAEVPASGFVWVEDRVINELGLKINQLVYIGEKAFKISRILVYEPDRGNSFYSFTPRILMNLSDVDDTQVIQPGSRVQYRYLFAGEPDAVSQLKNGLTTYLQANQKFILPEQASQVLTSTLDRAYRFLNITALIAVLLGATAAALVSFHYSNEMTYQYALFRCLGLQGRNMIAVIILPILFFTLLAMMVGFIVGGFAHGLTLNALSGLIPEKLPNPSLQPFILSALTGVIVVVSFAWPFLKKLLNTAPKLLLNRIEIQQQAIVPTLIIMVLGLSCLIYLGTQDYLVSIYLMGVLSAFVVVTYIVTKLMINAYVKFSEIKNVREKLSARNIKANQRMVIIQVIAITITFFSLAIISTIRDDIVQSWQSKLPETAPNVFVINLFSDDRENFLHLLEKNNILSNDLYPIVRGRLSAVNNMAIDHYVNQRPERGDESLNRDLALTWSTNLPADNEIIFGRWHDDALEHHSVSVEQGLADNLDISVGDTLSFTIQSKTITASVSSIRSVEWESFSPNFYMIFSPGVLDDFAASYLTSFYLNEEQRSTLPLFVREFSNATFFDVDFLISRIRGIADKISYAVEVILYFALISSILVFIAIEMILRQYRLYSSAIFKAVGAETTLIQKVFRTEFLIIGFIAGGLAYLLNLVVSYSITHYIIQGELVFNIKTALLCLVVAPLLVLMMGYFSLARTKNISVKKLLISS